MALSNGYVSVRVSSDKLSQAPRPLVLKHDNTEISILIPGACWAPAEQLREQFLLSLASTPAESQTPEVVEGDKVQLTPLELAAQFLKFSVTHAAAVPADSADGFFEVVRLVFAFLRQWFLKGNEVHVVATESLPTEAAVKTVVNAYLTALTALRARATPRRAYDSPEQSSTETSHDISSEMEVEEDTTLSASSAALFQMADEGRASLFAIFGGQGTSIDFFKETHDLFATYEPLVRPFVERMGKVLRRYAASSGTDTIHSKGFDVLAWLDHPATQPDDEYLVSAPVSPALIGLTQLMHYFVMCRVLDLTPGQVRRNFVAATGHSQGIVAATVIAASDSWESFYTNAERGLGLLFWMGTRSQQVYPATTLNPVILQDSLSNNEGAPSPMLAITHLRYADVVQHVELTNSHLPEDRHIKIALVNGPRSCVCTGPPQSLYGLNLRLRKLKAPSDADQSRVPFSKRRLKITSRFLPVTVPFHSEYLLAATDLIAKDIEQYQLHFDGQSMAIPVLASDTGADLRGEANISLAMITQICNRTAYWEKSTDVAQVTHIVDFGPGGISGIGGLTYRNKEGTGVQVVFAGALSGTRKNLCYKPALFDTRPESVRFSPNWAQDFRPRLVRTSCNDQLHIETRMSRLLGKPPLMVAGMTPSTVSPHFVASVLNAGYHIELAGGGYYNEKALRKGIHKIMAQIEPGLGITVNVIFINVRQWTFQFPLIQAMRREGLPIEGVCVGAGVPSLAMANEIVGDLQAAGIRHVSFKPSSISTILQVVNIAQHNPTMPIILQWTGGRGGGHHSFEDFHQPILQTYGAIREQQNVILVAGSGFGGDSDTLPYLTGDWSLEFDYPPMPFDGLLFGSRMMVALEGNASLGTKQAIVDAPGIATDAEWEQTYERPTGGVITVTSELGEPIHKLATRGVKLWKELDDTIFSLPRDKRLPALLAKKDYIIKRLNADFQKVWFGRKKDGAVADLPEMTYEEVVNRLVELMYVQREARWIDVSHRNMVGDFIRRVEERFTKEARPSSLQSYDALDTPLDFLNTTFWPAFSQARDQLLTSEDILYFITLCKRRGQKPVPFIPVFDKEFDMWFKKDSLWQSEDLAAVVDQDVERTCILQGPISARFSTKINEPAGVILGNIYRSHIQSLRSRYYSGPNAELSVPSIEYLGYRQPHTSLDIPRSVHIARPSPTERVVQLPATGDLSNHHLPSLDSWFELIAGFNHSWLRALLTSSIVIQDKHYIDNPLRRVLAPRRGQIATITYERVDSLQVSPVVSGGVSSPYGNVYLPEDSDLASEYSSKLGPISSHVRQLTISQVDLSGKGEQPFVVVQATIDSKGEYIDFIINEKQQQRAVPLHLRFRYVPDRPYAPIHEVMDQRNERIKSFYYDLWFGTSQVAELDVDRHHTFVASQEPVQSHCIQQFCQAVGNQAELYVDRGQNVVCAPVDFAIVVGWKAIIKAIFPRFINGDLLKLVHLSNGFRMVENASLLRHGDVVDTESSIQAVINTDSGKMVEVLGVVKRQGQPVMEVTSQFLYRGQFTDFEHTFRRTQETPMQIKLTNSKDLAVLRSKEWLEWDEESENQGEESLEEFPTVLIFRLATYTEFKDKLTFSKVQTTGTVTMLTSTKVFVKVASVNYQAGESHGNPVLSYLERVGEPLEQPNYFDNGGYSVMPVGEEFTSVVNSPPSNAPYAQVSGDFNPIHVNPYFSALADLPGTITHGMWTSASTRKFVETFAADNHPQRVTGYQVNFQGMVLPSDRLETKLYHIGMKNGKKLIKVETINQDQVVVLSGTAEVDQATTAYVFTGQGSQEKGMGMDLYESSPVAREIWDQADRHFMSNYGVSILDIVRNNPQSKTVHFGGAKGQAIRKNYIRMTYDVLDNQGNVKTLSLFPQVNETTPFYTFIAPNGLLSATQFTQPALTLMERAAFEDMRAKGLIQQDARFAGHSLGEYAALAAIGDLPLEKLVDVVFYRGMTMQSAVERDAQGHSNYAMVAVNPSRISKTFTETALRYVVDTIAHQSGGLLEIVNFNVENWQYIVSGELGNLDALANVLNFMKKANLDLAHLMETTPLETVKAQLVEIVTKVLKQVEERKQKNGRIILERGYATIPLKGIDVPFHSSFLLSGVSPFRSYLSRRLSPSYINVHLLCGKYIPNLTAKPFSLAKDYIQSVHDQTGSTRLAKVLKNWDTSNGYQSPGDQQRLGYTLLIELLAYQFASPVRWIETQDQLFKKFGVERLIELGPSPTLCGMAERTLKFKYEAYDDAMTYQRVNLCYSKNQKEIYYAFDPAPAATVESELIEAPAVSAPAPSAPVPVPAAAPVPISAAPAVAVDDVPLKAVDVLQAVIAQKLKKALSDVPMSKTIKDLVGGKSTLQNEILGDLQKEFGSNVPDKSEETPLDELGETLGAAFSGELGKHTHALVSKMISSKMPGGFTLTTAKQYLTTTYGLGPNRTSGVLLVGTTMEPTSRLGSEADAKAWLDSIVQVYAQRQAITLTAGGSGAAGGASGAAGGTAMIDSAEFQALQTKQDSFVRQQLAVLARYLGIDLRAGQRHFEAEQTRSAGLQAELDLWLAEHGEIYAEGIRPIFTPFKARRFDSYWNWARQDALSLYYDIVYGRLTAVDRDVTAQCIHVMNRSSPGFLRYMDYNIQAMPVNKGETYKLAKELASMLRDNCDAVATLPPVYRDVSFPTAPQTTVTNDGDIKYEEVQREGIRKLEDYVKEMAQASKLCQFSNRQTVQHNLVKIYKIIKSQTKLKKHNRVAVQTMYNDILHALAMSSSAFNEPSNTRGPRRRRPVSKAQETKRETIPFLHLKRKTPTGNWEYNQKLSNQYLDVLADMARSGVSFQDKIVLVTGCGRGSIGAEILKGLLSGGAQVVVTTSRYNRTATEYYQSIYQRHGSKNSSLVVVPFNQASLQDVQALVDFIYSTDKATGGLGWDLDYIVPFAAIPENGREISDLDSKSELAHRAMLTNLLRLLGHVKTHKQQMGSDTRPAQVILPLSPNHGTLGSDGLYSESKLSLETLFNRWHSENWGSYLAITGAVIGWTRGTGLMAPNNIIAQGLEKLGMRTFSAQEMAFNILGLMHPTIAVLSQSEPVWADLNGGFQFINNLQEITQRLRHDLRETAEIRRAIVQETKLDFSVVHGAEAERAYQKQMVTPRANLKFAFPKLKPYSALQHLSYLRGMLDLDNVVVVTGYSEVGPYGNSRTRWEMEANGEFSLEGCIEMAWIMGFIKHHNGPLKSGVVYSGWVDAKTNEPVKDIDVKAKYESQILEHSGIRLIEPELFEGYQPRQKLVMREVLLEHDLEEFETSAEEAQQFQVQNGEFVDVYENKETGQWLVKFRKGATLMVPKALRFDRLVAGQIPTGWDAARYGVPKDIIDQVDMVTLYVLVSTVEALVASGVTDPYEFYKYVHVSEVGNCSGSGIGGMRSLGKMYRDRLLDRPVQNDILQETFINTMAAWVNLLLLSSAGPIKTPVGACATAAESVEIGVETIQSGKAKIVLVGGYDDFQEEGSYEFGNMKATSNSDEEFKRGRTPREMSRPTTTTRSGFMESYGSGIQVLMSAQVAIEMGVPIYGIVALTNTATDKEGRSVPAPGQGILTTAREIPGKLPSPMLDINYRRRQLTQRRQQIQQWVEQEYQLLHDELTSLKSSGQFPTAEVSEADYLAERTRHIELEAKRQEKEALNTWGNFFYKKNPHIAPLRGALASFGLTVDDIGVSSLHGTSTKANDKNESDVLNKQFAHLGRTPGNACPSIFQKYLTGHPKAAAAAWMLNGLLQVLETGIIPGNRNADNIDEILEQYEYILYPSRSIHTDGIKAGLLKSFGFGQVGSEVLVIHPDYLFGALDEVTYSTYCAKNATREAKAYRYWHDAMAGVSSFFQAKSEAPYSDALESQIYLNPLARAGYDTKHSTYVFDEAGLTLPTPDTAVAEQMVQALTANAQQNTGDRGVGVDVELVGNVNIENDTFLERNFTPKEISYCRSRPDPQASFTGRWSAKESVIKAISSLAINDQKVWVRGEAAPLNDIEILPSLSGAPQVVLHGEAQEAAAKAGVQDVKVSISHSGSYAIALAIASE